MILKCTNCGKSKDVRPYRAKTFKFCSYDCKKTSMMGHVPWNKGVKYTKEQKSKLNMDGLSLGHNLGEKHYKWKGDFASYSALHYWLARQVGKAIYCSYDKKHTSTRYHWANISGQYKRDVSDFMSLCPSCHNKYDKIAQRGWATRKEKGGVI